MFCSNTPQKSHHTATIIENELVAERTFRLRISATELAERAMPGQFVMLRLTAGDAPLLGRPLGIYRTFDDGSMDFVYLVVGKMTERLSLLPVGTPLNVWGTLGNGWCCDDNERERYDNFVMVAGGCGHTPFYRLIQHWQRSPNPPRLTFLYGAKTKTRISCIDDFKSLGIEVKVATDDGTFGHSGLITKLIGSSIDKHNERTKLLACGPSPMLRAAASEAKRLKLPCDVSLESPMSCGLGICFGCVVEYQDANNANEWDYKRTCVDGPVFDAYRLRW
jgi:dihydroorotate dehydrogenase electron transfer subunit